MLRRVYVVSQSEPPFTGKFGRETLLTRIRKRCVHSHSGRHNGRPRLAATASRKASPEHGRSQISRRAATGPQPARSLFCACSVPSRQSFTPASLTHAHGSRAHATTRGGTRRSSSQYSFRQYGQRISEIARSSSPSSTRDKSTARSNSTAVTRQNSQSVTRQVYTLFDPRYKWGVRCLKGCSHVTSA